MEHHPVVIIGAGSAGLTAAYELIKAGIKPIVLEKADKVGGIAAPRRTRDTTLTLVVIAFSPKSKQCSFGKRC